MIDKWFHAVNFVRVLVDFILIAQYRSHDEQILRYLNQAFFRVNFFKSVFRETRQFVQENENEHFNFFKFHVMSHYSDFIRKYDTTDDYDISHDEIKHKYMIKQYYDRTNKRETFQKQLIQHNRRRMKVLIMKNIMRYEKKCQSFVVDEVIKFTNIKTTRDFLELSLLRKCSTKNSQSRHIFESLQLKNWCTIKELNVFMNISNLIFVLIVFIKERRRALNHLMTDSRNKYRREKDFIWVEEFEICFHDFITCWISKKHNSFDSKDLSKKKIRCKLNWQNKFDRWRRDFVWAQEAISNEKIVSRTIRNRTIDQILCILTIRDSERRDNKNKSQNYSDVLLNIKNSRNKNMSNEINEMIELND